MSPNQEARSDRKTTFVQWFVHLAIIWLLVGGAVPGINESHYLTKAKHALDASFAPGDLFLDSHDSHLVSTYFAGTLAQFLPLSAVAWIGRFVAWGLMAFAWIRFSRALKLPAIVSPLALATWYFGVKYGHWAGEWAIGGFEGKAIAYPCVLLGIAAAIGNKWSHSWIWFAVAIVWHPLVGGWAGLSVGLVWLLSRTPKLEQLPWFGLALAISSIGIVPAFLGIGGADREGNIVASQIHVYYRLSHHLCPLAFDDARHSAAFFSMGAFVAANIFWLMARLWLRGEPASKHAKDTPQPQSKSVVQEQFLATGKLLAIAWFAVLFALCGFLIDFFLSNPDRATTYQPILASKILRFYWFRWADIAVPLASSVVIWQLVTVVSAAEPKREEPNPENGSFLLGKLVLAAFAGIVVLFVSWHAYQNWDDSLPPADKLLVSTPGQLRELQWNDVDSNRYVDWLAACHWIRDNTPSDSLWLTPKYQQSFKWHAQRAEVVCWKDVPQDNSSVIEWYKRIQILNPRRTPSGKVRGWIDEELVALHKIFKFDYVLVDRTYYSKSMHPPMLQMVYPINIDNRSFAIFKMAPLATDK